MNIIRWLKNKLFLNDIRHLEDEKEKRLFDEIERLYEINRFLLEQQDKLSEQQDKLYEKQSTLSEKQDTLFVKIEEFKKSNIEYIDKKTLKIGENTSKFISAAILNRETFRPYKNFCKGKKVVICGAGPSLQDYIPIEGAVHIALNRAFLFDKVQFDFVFAQDYEGVVMVKDELRKYRRGKCDKLFGKMYRDKDFLKTNFPESYISECNAKTFATDAFYPDDLTSNHPFIAEIDSRAISCGNNVGLCVMQFALWMNPDEIYIVGCDHSGGHFSQKGLSAELSIADKALSEATWKNSIKVSRNMWMQLRTFAQIYYPNTKIISVNPIGLKGIFTDWYQVTNKIVENVPPTLKSLLDPFVEEKSQISNLPEYNKSNEDFKYNIDEIQKKGELIRIYGWVYKENDEIYVYAKLGKTIFKAKKIIRGDVKNAFNLKKDDKGFLLLLPYLKNYEITLYFVNESEGVIYEEKILKEITSSYNNDEMICKDK